MSRARAVRSGSPGADATRGSGRDGAHDGANDCKRDRAHDCERDRAQGSERDRARDSESERDGAHDGARACAHAARPLHGLDVDIAGQGSTSRYASALLAALGARTRERDGPHDAHPALVWARCGLMSLTGARDGAPLMLAAPVAACADGVLQALAALGARLPAAFADGAARLGERAALLGLQRNGAISAGGSCRLLPTADGMLAVNLPRADDWQAVPAWLDGREACDWDALAGVLRERDSAQTVERARLLGLAVAAARLPQASAGRAWCRAQRLGARREAGARGARRPLVVDLSSLWAGPLCGQILHRLGARVIKVESRTRPDGARSGPAVFFDRMNAGKACVALDFGSARELDALRRLLARADIVIESARPRALRQLGIDAQQLLGERAGLTWVGISGYGRDEPGANGVAFGDDAGVAGGASSVLAEASGSWVFCGDALADPLAGLHAALAAWSGFAGGGGVLIDVALQQVVAHCVGWELPADAPARAERWRAWTALAWRAGLAGCRPMAPAVDERARALGADTRAVLDEQALPC